MCWRFRVSTTLPVAFAVVDRFRGAARGSSLTRAVCVASLLLQRLRGVVIGRAGPGRVWRCGKHLRLPVCAQT
jgi:hypothetical protein